MSEQNGNGNGTHQDGVRGVRPEVMQSIGEQAERAGGEWQPPYPDSIGSTMYDTPVSEDGTITVLMPPDSIAALPAQALVRIVSRDDGRVYLAAVVKGPFAEPDGVRADAPLIVTTAVRGATPFLPRF